MPAGPGGLSLTKAAYSHPESWTDNAANETGFLIQRADNAGFSLGVVNATVAANVTTFRQDVPRGKAFYYRVLAFNDTIQSGWSNTASVTGP
ncbi:MAG TPA: hypothetical protein VNL77_01090 [Roseiflexaceae bacterium]|nr:hypothetical protein [Roseiflexaceae bacterium]